MPAPATNVPCPWAPPTDALYRAYHDEEWGVPQYDSGSLWAKLQLDGLQAGLAWITILRKRASIAQELDGLDPEALAQWDEARIATALANPGIIRSPQKLRAIVLNARAFLAMRDKGRDFSDFLWAFVGGRPRVSGVHRFRDAPTRSPESERMAKELKGLGFSFCGPTIAYAFMQAVGMVNDHERHCPRFLAVQGLGR